MRLSDLLLFLPALGGFVCQAIPADHGHGRLSGRHFKRSGVNNGTTVYKARNDGGEYLRNRNAMNT
jgi:hypothetical protein